MGLSSLPILNKLGFNSFWLNIYNSEKFYITNQSLFMYIELLFQKLSTERFFFKFFNEFKDKPQYFNQFKYKKDIKYTKTINLSFIGEIWFLVYSNYLILSPLIFFSNIVDKKRLKFRVNSKPIIFFYLELYDNL